MKTSLFLVSILLGGSLFAQTAPQADLSNSLLKKFNEEAKQQSEAPPISFMENKGQIHDQNYKPRPDVLFGAMAGNMAFHLKTTGVSYQLTRVDSYKEVEDERTHVKRKEIDQQTIYRVDLSWLNANSNLRTTTDQTLEGYNNYYLESCPNGALNVKSYTGVTLHNLYNGINLHYYEKGGQLKHDYIVAPGANYQQIQLKVEGATVRINEDGSLTLTTPLGKILEGAPIVYQNGKQLKAKWSLKNNTLGFEIENYNPNQELIIDPVTRVWGTYYGAGGSDEGYSCATDASGNVYLVGNTESSTGTVIATAGAHQSTSGSNFDAFLVKFNTAGVRQWGTYYGGSGLDDGRSCVTDATGDVFICGFTSTNTSNVIATAGSHQEIFAGGIIDAFLAKFNSNGVREWGTYYGGTGSDRAYSCSIDAANNVYFGGVTNSVAGIASVAAHQTIIGGDYDAYLVKFNSVGIHQWGTYYGGTAADNGRSCASDGFGNIYLTGYTQSNNGTAIATAGSHQPVLGSVGNNDAFLVKFNSSGVREWGTYYGGTQADVGLGCATDPTGSVYFAGYSFSNSGIGTIGVHQTSNQGSGDAILVKFNSLGVRQWGTYYGGAGEEIGYSCAIDATYGVYMSGYTTTTSGAAIATAGSHQPIIASFTGHGDAFLVKFNSSGVRQSGTYYGGNFHDHGSSIALDATGNVYMSGYSNYSVGTGIATAGSHQSTHGSGNYDAFLVKFSGCGAPETATVTETACDSYTWPLNGTTYTTSGTYTHVGTNAAGCPLTTTLNLTINNSTTATVNQTACESYTWALNGTTYTSSGTYTHVGTNAAGCPLTTTLNLTINNSTTATVTETACDSYTWALNGTTYTTSGTYTHVGTNASGCPLTTTLNLTINNSTTATVNQTACDSYTWALNGTTYTTSGTYSHVGTNAAGCQLTTTLNLTINNSTTATVTETACDSYTWALNGTTYATSGTYTHVGTNANGCPLTTTLNLTINNSSTATVTETACDSYTWALNGTTYTTSGTYTHVGTNASGCTLTTTLNLTINNSSTSTVTETACDSYTWVLNGTTYTSSGSYTHVGTNAAGCQLTTTLNLTINTVNVATTLSGITITANASGASYQWIDCNNGNALIPGATAQSFTATANGSYAVIVTNANCTDTSACQVISSVGIDEIAASDIEVYPNPTSGNVHVILGKEYQNTSIKLINAIGQVMLHKTYPSTNEITFEIEGAPGVYFLEIESAEQVLGRVRVVKN